MKKHKLSGELSVAQREMYWNLHVTGVKTEERTAHVEQALTEDTEKLE
jgi:hypothetical protein